MDEHDEVVEDGPHEQPLFDVGFLFVHGIGQQRKGSTLAEAGDALHRYIGTEFAPAPPTDDPTLSMSDVHLTDDGPAHGTIRFAPSSDTTAEWLLAESHWAETFLPPSASATVRWLSMRAPYLLLSRATEGLVESWRAWWNRPQYWWRIALQMIWIFAAVPIGVVLVVVLLIAVFLRTLIPFAWVQTILGQIEAILTSFLGDSYLFTASAVSSTAMSTRVAEEIDWIRARAKRVIVVAHSQGASVATQALATLDPVEVLVTYGAGISQLAWLRSRAATCFAVVFWSVIWVVGLAGVVVTVVQAIEVTRGGSLPPWLWAVMLFLWPVLLGGAGRLRDGIAGSRRNVVLTAKPQVLAHRWLDLWASADPVSGGPSTGHVFAGTESVRLWNRGNVGLDHSGYFANRVEFVARLVQIGLGASETPGARPVADALARSIEVDAALRQRRGRWLETLRFVVVAAFVIASLRLAGVFSEQLDAPVAWLRNAVPPVRRFLEPILGLTPQGIGAIAGLAVIALGVYGVGLLIWGGWSRAERSGSMQRQGSTAGLVAFVVFVGLVATAGTAIGFLGLAQLVALEEAVVDVFGMGVLAGIVLAILAALTRRWWRTTFGFRRLRSGDAVIATLLAFAAWFLLWMTVCVVQPVDLTLLPSWAFVALVGTLAVMCVLSVSAYPSLIAAIQRPIRDPMTYRPFKYIPQARPPAAAAPLGWALAGVILLHLGVVVLVPHVPGEARIVLDVLWWALPFAEMNLAIRLGEQSTSATGVVLAVAGFLAGVALSVVYPFVAFTA
ncbi:hypothetical protein KXS11_06410 [Plantibacter flavus]|uniref:hypothetical protein n=1 Tax=Plantibacter flavus TaxID=150123 RepID=UPI003F16C200